MWHSSLNSNDVYNVSHSVGYPVLVSLTNKLKLCVSDYALNRDSKLAEYVLAFDNGVNVMNFVVTKDGNMKVSYVDNPFGGVTDWMHTTTLVQTKNSSYLVRTVTSDKRTAGVKLKSRMDDSIKNGLVSFLSTLTSQIRQAANNKNPSLRSISDDEMQLALSVLFGNNPITSLPPPVLANLEGRYNDYVKRVDHHKNHNLTLEGIFQGEKWIVIARQSLYAPGGYVYYVGALNAGAMLNAAKKGYWGSNDISDMTVPVQLYPSLNKVPDEYRNDLLGSLSMFKQYRIRNHPTVKSLDTAGLMPHTTYLLDPDSGAAAWSFNGATALMIDK